MPLLLSAEREMGSVTSEHSDRSPANFSDMSSTCCFTDTEIVILFENTK